MPAVDNCFLYDLIKIMVNINAYSSSLAQRQKMAELSACWNYTSELKSRKIEWLMKICKATISIMTSILGLGQNDKNAHWLHTALILEKS